MQSVPVPALARMGQALLIRFESLPEMAADKLFDRFSVTGAEDGADTDGHETSMQSEGG
jgi:hypothetical protein